MRAFRISALAWFCAGIGMGMAIGHARSAGDHAALERDAAVCASRLAGCEDALTEDVNAARDHLAGQCEFAASACAQVAESASATEQIARGLLWVAPKVSP